MPQESGVPPRLAAKLARARHDWLSRLESESEELTARRPASDRWSAAEVGTHLVLTEELVTLAFEQLFAAPAAAPRAVGLRPARFKALLIGVRSIHVRAPKKVEPKAALPLAEISRRAGASRERLLSNLAFAIGRPDLGRIVVPHPYFGPLTLQEWAGVVAAHEARHAKQMAEALVAARRAS